MTSMRNVNLEDFLTQIRVRAVSSRALAQTLALAESPLGENSDLLIKSLDRLLGDIDDYALKIPQTAKSRIE